MADSDAADDAHPIKQEPKDDSPMGAQVQPDLWAWQRCDGEAAPKRIQILEQAVQDGFKNFGDIAKIIRKQQAESAPKRNTRKNAQATSFDAIIDTAEDVLQDYATLKKESRKHEINVGVVGGTGMGKTSLLNAILGNDGLLSTSNKEASTAVHCSMASNKYKAKHYKAEMRFRKLASVKEQLRQGFETLQAWQKANEAVEASDCEDDDEDNDPAAAIQALNDLKEDVKDFVEEVSLIWGPHTRNQLLKMTVDDLLKEDDERTKLLGTSKFAQAEEPKDLAEMIEPYISTTPYELDAGGECQISPLVDEVRIYCPSPLLDNGIVLHDFPGMADANTNRCSIAEGKLKDMDIILVIGHINRISDEATATQLMKPEFLTRLEMNGQHKSFAIILSKMDDLGIEAGLAKPSSKDTEGDKALKAVQILENRLADAKSELKVTAKKLNQANANLAKLSKGKGKGKKTKAAQKKENEARATKKGLTRKQELTKKAIKRDEALLISKTAQLRQFQIQQRNQHVTKRLLERQRTMAVERGRDEEDLPPIFPTSSLAYWPHHTAEDGVVRKTESKPLPGFPTKRHSGIPALRKYIREAAIPARERHARTMLNQLAGLQSRVATWSENISPESLMDLSTCQETIDTMVEDTFDRLEAVSREFDQTLFGEIEKCHPLLKWKDRKPTKKCLGQTQFAVDQWIRKDPNSKKPATDKLAKTQKIHVHTQAAIIRKKGGRHVTRSGTRQEYNWIEKITEIVRTTIKAEWMDAMQVRLPKVEENARYSLEDRLAKILKPTRVWFKQFPEEHQEYLNTQLDSFVFIQRALADQIGNGIATISTRAREASEGFPVNVQQNWGKAWNHCEKQLTGKGQRDARQDYLLSFVKHNNTRIFKKNIEVLYGILATHAEAFQEELPPVWARSKLKYEKQLRLIMSKITKDDTNDGTDRSAHDKWLKLVWARVMKWQNDWSDPAFKIDIDEDMSIPEPVFVPDEKPAEEEPTGAADEDVDMDAEPEEEDSDAELSEGDDSDAGGS